MTYQVIGLLAILAGYGLIKLIGAQFIARSLFVDWLFKGFFK